jgi:hypothetical protein
MENVGSPTHGHYLQGYRLPTLEYQNLNFHRSENLNLINHGLGWRGSLNLVVFLKMSPSSAKLLILTDIYTKRQLFYTTADMALRTIKQTKSTF